MTNVIKFPTLETAPQTNGSNVTMTLTRNINGLTVSINLAKLDKEELLEALMPLPSKTKEESCEKIALVKKYINQ